MLQGLFDAVAVAVVTGAFAWAAVESRSNRNKTGAKLDRIDVMLRGDGNGNIGIAEHVRQVHAEVTTLGKNFEEHKCGERARVVAVIREEVEFEDDGK